jgi:hypothetical protein
MNIVAQLHFAIENYDHNHLYVCVSGKTIVSGPICFPHVSVGHENNSLFRLPCQTRFIEIIRNICISKLIY